MIKCRHRTHRHYCAVCGMKAPKVGINQQRILVLVADGLTTKEIAKLLHEQPRNVEYHVAALMGKVNANCKVELVVQAHRLRLINLDKMEPYTGYGNCSRIP